MLIVLLEDTVADGVEGSSGASAFRKGKLLPHFGHTPDSASSGVITFRQNGHIVISATLGRTAPAQIQEADAAAQGPSPENSP
jgi:hypothetical protein